MREDFDLGVSDALDYTSAKTVLREPGKEISSDVIVGDMQLVQ